jgi:hypothetical protein
MRIFSGIRPQQPTEPPSVLRIYMQTIRAALQISTDRFLQIVRQIAV